MTTTAISKSWEGKQNTHSMDFAQAVTPSDVTVFTKPTRGVVFGQTGTAAVRMSGAVMTATASIVGAAGDISAVASTSRFTSTTSGKFDTVVVGDRVTVRGFTNEANNGDFIVTNVVTGASASITVKRSGGQLTSDALTAVTLINETPAGTAVSVALPPRATQQSVAIAVVAGTFYPLNIDKFLSTGTVTVTSGTIFW